MSISVEHLRNLMFCVQKFICGMDFFIMCSTSERLKGLREQSIVVRVDAVYHLAFPRVEFVSVSVVQVLVGLLGNLQTIL